MSCLPVDPNTGRVMDKTHRRERAANVRRDLGDDGGIREHSARSVVPGEGIRTPETHPPTPIERQNDRMTERVSNAGAVVDADGWVITSPQHRQALGLGTLAVNNVVPAAGVTEYADNIERVQPAPLPRRPQAAPEPPTLTEKQEKVFAYFEANARYDKVKQAWIFPTVVVMAKETGCAGSYVQGLKVEWMRNKAVEEPQDDVKTPSSLSEK